ncbi:hypothetical protein ABT56_01515 [Photobacterium aquae]|uniref:DoxX family protein n=1 Tax=Photobacterium aquae TaxID=1195763 RepID=A0A0J1K3C2_9GAMM|nr:hypothetical protein [Photobacterium aquae]KLV08912.1 hypothetical protein ABT56_01515 [Photobacterium aquae]
MKTQGPIHHFSTYLVFAYSGTLMFKGLVFPEQHSRLLNDTNLAPCYIIEPLAFLLPMMLGVTLLLNGLALTSLRPVIASLACHLLLPGIALTQGLHLDRANLLPGSLSSNLYSTIEPQFFIMLTVFIIANMLHINNKSRATTCAHNSATVPPIKRRNPQ